MNKSYRQSKWDFAKFFLMYMVIFGHVYNSPVSPTILRINVLSLMPSFFFISGYFQSEINDFTDLTKKCKRTYHRIFLPLLTWGCILLLLTITEIYLPQIVNSNYRNLLSFLKYTPYYIFGANWFLTSLLICIFWGSLMSLFMNRFKRVGMMFLSLSPFIFVIYSPFIFEHYHFSFVWFFYTIGMLYKKFEKKFALFSESIITKVAAIVILIIVLLITEDFPMSRSFYYTENQISTTPFGFIIYRWIASLAASAIILFGIITYYNQHTGNKYLSKLSDYGKDTLFIYCSHMLVIKFVIYPYVLPFLPFNDGRPIIIFASILLALLIAGLIYAILEGICIWCKKFSFTKTYLLGNRTVSA